MSFNGIPQMVGSVVALKITSDLAMKVGKMPKSMSKRRKMY